MAAHINDEMLNKMDAYWRAANYLAAGQLYLLDNPLLKEPLKPEHIKKKIVGHWGTVPGQNLIYVHLNRIIKQYNLDMIRCPVRVTAAISSWRTPTSRALTARFTRTSARTPRA